MTDGQLDRVQNALRDHYDVERVLGAGGMATVYLAHDRKHDRDVAVKVLHPDLAAAVGGERFLHEIKLTAQLNHPHILSLIDSGEADGLLYYVMPYIEGESLRDRINHERQLSIDEALKIAGEVADALEHAHGKGIIHRDIKPENILLSDRHAILADFGIAHGVTEAGGERLTATGIAIGTVEYMSPEQAVGERDIDARSDLYALGCVLYEMLVGQPPFTGLNAQAITAKKTLDPVPSIRTVRDTVSQGIDASVAKALARVPADRYRTTAEFVAALAEPSVPPAPAPPRILRATALLGLVGLAAAAGIVVPKLIESKDATVLPSGSTIAVIPLAPSSPDAELSRLGRDLVIALSYNLSGQGDVRAISSSSMLRLATDVGRPYTLEESARLATQLSATSFLHGSVLPRGSDAQAIVALYRTTDTTELARTSVTASPDDVAAFADTITVDILRQIWRRGDPITPNLAATLTGSPEALRHFVKGEKAFAANRWNDAEDEYAAAYHADTTLYLASLFYHYAAQGTYSSNPVKDSTVLRAIYGHVDELPEPYPSWLELGILGIVPDQWADSTWTDRLSAEGRLATQYPDFWYIAFSYADNMSHWGPMYGYTADQALAAWTRLMDQNPQLDGKDMREAWEHGLLVGFGRDPEFTDRALEALGPIHGWVGTPARYRLMIAARDGPPDPLLVDSAVRELGGIPQVRPHARFLFETAQAGLPQLGIEVSTRLLNRRQLDLADSVVRWHKLYLPNSWAARGAWDSALAAADRYADGPSLLDREMELYRIAAAGVILAGVDPKEAVARRPDTTSTAMTQWLLGGRWATGDERRGELAWLDGIVAYAEADSAGLAQAIENVARLSGPPEYSAASLQAFQWALQGDTRQAADTLVRMQVDWRVGQHYAPRGASHFMDGISRLTAAEWLLLEGDTLLARKTLGYHTRDPVGWVGGAAQQVAASLALRRQAVVEEALGNDDLAIDYYQQFLRRYDMPTPQHRQWVNDAKESLARLISTDPPN